MPEMIQYLQNMPEYVSGSHVSISTSGGRDNDKQLDLYNPDSPNPLNNLT